MMQHAAMAIHGFMPMQTGMPDLIQRLNLLSPSYFDCLSLLIIAIVAVSATRDAKVTIMRQTGKGNSASL